MTLLTGGIKSDPKFWGRKWRIVITLTDGTVLDDKSSTTSYGLDVSNLRVTGTITDKVLTSYNRADITIYNLNRTTEKLILSQGKKIVIELGYQDPDLYGAVFSGTIYQAKRGKANVTDYTLTLHALGDYDVLTQGIISATIKRGTNYRDLLEQVAKSSDPILEVGEVPEDWGKDKNLSRGLSIVGKTKDVLKGISDSTNTMLRIDGGKINVISLTDKPTEAFELNYRTGLVGQPAQNKDGVAFQCLINPKIKLNSWVHINNAIINESDIDFGNANAQTQIPLDVDGLYRVIERQFQFDTRGNDWYINCQTYTQTGALPAFLIDGATKGF